VSAKTDPETLALRARPRPVTRLNRRMLVGMVAAIVCLVMGVTIWSLRPSLRLSDVRPELHNVDRIARAEGIDRLPPDYSKLLPPKPPETAIPILGRPLPGDLGVAMLRAEQGNSQTPGFPSTSTADTQRSERASREREVEDAAKAPLFFRSSSQKQPTGPIGQSPAEDAPTKAAEGVRSSFERTEANSSASTQNSDLAIRSNDRLVVSQYSIQSAVSPYQVMAGSVIPAALITGINSDLPGVLLASVTEPVYDTKLGRYLLIPQGTRLIGEYDSQVAFGQRRVLLVWNRLIFPDASSLTLDRLPAVDTAGNSGLEDGVDRHWRQLLAGAALSTLIGVAAELAAPDRNSGQVIVSARQSVQDGVNQVGQELTRRNLNVQPTLTIRPGYPVRIIVSKDLVLRPYQPLFIERSQP
jgi:type IV secretion system protein VirB10